MNYDSKVSSKKRNKINILVLCFVFAMMWTISVVASEQAVIGKGEKIPTFNCEEDFGIRKALALLGSLCGKNIVPSPNGGVCKSERLHFFVLLHRVHFFLQHAGSFS